MGRVLIVSALILTAFPLVQPLAHANSRSVGFAGSVAPAATPTDALHEARRTGAPVEVADLTTETRQVIANPTGTFTLKSNRRPVRVRKNGAWRGIDTTLARNPNGSLSPVATAQDVAFSGGGSGPLVTIRRDATSLAFSWPAALPSPVLQGATATYPAVLPGVDLQITAQADGYVETLVVHDAKAAANPALTQLRLTATGAGLNLAVTPDNRLSATDSQGVEVLSGPAPRMWDSHLDDHVGPAPSATESGSGRVTPLPVTAVQRGSARAATDTSTTELTLAPDPAALTGPDVVYPLYLDPSMTVHRMHWAEVTDNGWHYYDDSQLAQVGYCNGWDGCGSPAWRARSYFQFDTTPLWPRNGYVPTIWRANLFANQVWSADHNCGGGQPTTVWESGGIDTGTRWPGPAGTAIDTRSSNAGGPCAASNLVFDVRYSANRASQGSWATLVLGLLANNENDPFQWKKFDNNPLLEVDFSFPPNNATGLHVSNEVRCTGKVITSDARPTLYGTATDNNNPPLLPALWHDVRSADESRRNTTASGIRISSGTEGAWQIPPVDRLSDGDWKFRIYVDNSPEDPPHNLHNPNNGGFSDWYPFTVRATPPPTAPKITSTHDYPDDSWGAPAGAPGAIAVTTHESNVVGYTYTFGGAGTEVVPNTSDCVYNKTFGTSGGWIPHSMAGVDWIPIPPGLAAGPHTLHVRSFDDAHNLSPETGQWLDVAPNTGQTTQRFEAESLPRSQPAGQNIQLLPVGDCCNVSFSGGAALGFWGTAAGQSYTLSFQTPTDSTYRIGIGLIESYEQGRLEFRIDGQLIGNQNLGRTAGSFDDFNVRSLNSYHPLGIRRLPAGTHTLTVTVTGTNPASSGTRYGGSIDFLDLTQTTRYEAEESTQVVVTQPAGQNIPITTNTNTTGDIDWSGGTQLLFQSNRANTSFDLTFQAPIEADYALGIGITTANDYGEFTPLLDGKPYQDVRGNNWTWDGYNQNVTPDYRTLGGAHLTAGNHTLTIKVVDSNSQSVNNRYQVGVDYLSVVPLNNVTAASFTAAMNNDGVSADGTVADLDLMGNSLSAETLAAAGYAPGAAATINGATFTMPTPRSDGADNVLAIGQTIPLPAAQQIKASAVGLLVMSSCEFGGFVTLTYSDTDPDTHIITTTTQDLLLPNPWSDYADNADVVLPYQHAGTAIDRAHTPMLLALFVPADPTKTLRSITLPNDHSEMLATNTGCGIGLPGVHVFAIAPRPATTGWIGTWAAPPDTAVPPSGSAGFGNQTLRTVIYPTVSGSKIRIRLSNTASATAVTFDAATIAAQAGTGMATLTTPAPLTFGGSNRVTVPAGGEALSDPVAYPSTGGGSGDLTVSLHLPTAVAAASVHGQPTTPSFLANANVTADSTGTPFSTRLAGVFYVSAAQVSTSDNSQGTVAVLGDQLSAIAPPGSGQRFTWVDALPGKLNAAGVPLPGGIVNGSQAGQPAIGHWRLNDGTGTTARDSTGSANATLTGGASWSTDHGGSVAFNGTTGFLAASGPVLAPTGSFTVSAWVKLNAATTAPQTVVSQDSSDGNGFALQYTGSAENTWALVLPSSTTGAAPLRAVHDGSAQIGAWTHLIGVYEASTRQATIYVDGSVGNDPTIQLLTSRAAANGPLIIGRGQANGSPSAFLHGSVSDVRVYQRAVDEEDVWILIGSAFGDEPGFIAAKTELPDQTVDRTVLNQPGLRTVIVALGANDVLAESAYDLYTPINRMKNYRRNDGMLINIIVTTVPPLGLADTDEREQGRQEFNARLLAHYTDMGANQIVDIAAAVQDPARPSQVKPAYLTNGAPNAAYHNAIAQAIADAASRFPPEAQF